MTSLLEFKDVSFNYGGVNKRNILKNANVSFESGKVYAIIGPSGSGKTTAISLAGALDVPTSGEILFEGTNIKKIGYTNHRKKNVSLIFQNYNLINYMTAMENVIVAMAVSGAHKGQQKEVALKLLTDLGLQEDELKRSVLQLSGGQQQRVAIARSLASNAPIIIADEPTGNLDSKTAAEITDILVNLARDLQKCVIVVTHSKSVAAVADFSYTFKDGAIVRVDVKK